jgi:hypothetical protein
LSWAKDTHVVLKLPGHEIVGQRAVEVTSSAELVDMWCRITSKIVKYGFSVRYADLEAPRTGIFDGLTITLDPDVGFEMQCFILLHEAGVTTLDQWYSDFVETDWRYVRHYYQQGSIPDWNDCRAQGCTIIEAMPIPPVTLRQVAVRFAF